ncbi:MAG: hypothetical protein BWY06_03050 [Candidatus Latescibacteria bacterium ADurb.Bin168]|nr:MAG: hypothetical protein BWY06_03050 [Candidatus Latescibacteria bacterium ADurb.Bin168]
MASHRIKNFPERVRPLKLPVAKSPADRIEGDRVRITGLAQPAAIEVNFIPFFDEFFVVFVDFPRILRSVHHQQQGTAGFNKPAHNDLVIQHLDGNLMNVPGTRVPFLHCPVSLQQNLARVPTGSVCVGEEKEVFLPVRSLVHPDGRHRVTFRGKNANIRLQKLAENARECRSVILHDDGISNEIPRVRFRINPARHRFH